MVTKRNYIQTNEKIKKAYIEYIKVHKEMPTQQQMADECNVTRQTVNTHLNKINLSELAQPFKVFGNHVLMGLGKKAMKGDAQAAKLFFMLVYDWSEKTEHKVDGGLKIIFEDAVKDNKDNADNKG